MNRQPFKILKEIIAHIPTHLLYNKCLISRTWYKLVRSELYRHWKDCELEYQKQCQIYEDNIKEWRETYSEINYFLQLKIYYTYILSKVTMPSQQESAIQEEFKRLGNIKVPLKTYDEIYEEIFLRRAKRATQEEFKRLGGIKSIGKSDYFIE